MSITSRTIGSVMFGLVLLSASAWAASSAIEGTVTDPKGRVLKDAEIRIESKGGSKVAKSDAKGHYVYGVEAGTYRVNLVVNGAVKASINNVQVKVGEATRLNFDLKASQGAGPAKKVKHMVYMPSETGSNLGGRWVEVDENGKADAAGVNNVQKGNVPAVQSVGSAVANTQPGGH